jgi:hypothetical protein
VAYLLVSDGSPETEDALRKPLKLFLNVEKNCEITFHFSNRGFLLLRTDTFAIFFLMRKSISIRTLGRVGKKLSSAKRREYFSLFS